MPALSFLSGTSVRAPPKKLSCSRTVFCQQDYPLEYCQDRNPSSSSALYMAERPHTLLEQAFAVFSAHAGVHWEAEYSSYLYWKCNAATPYRNEGIIGILHRAYVDYKGHRSLSRSNSGRDIAAIEKAYINRSRLELRDIRPRQRRQPKLHRRQHEYPNTNR